MIASGDIFAQIDDSQGMVRFLEEPYSSESPDMLSTLDEQIARSMRLADKVQNLNFEVLPPLSDKQMLRNHIDLKVGLPM